MAARVPRHALTFMTNSAKLATKHGLKQGMTRATAKANPTLLVVEAAGSVAEAVNSYLKLKTAREHRDGLRRVLPHEEERLRLERQELSEQLDLAKKELKQNKEIQKRLGGLVLACGRAWGTSWDELHAIRSSDLPDLEAFDIKFRTLENAWSGLQHALENYNETSV